MCLDASLVEKINKINYDEFKLEQQMELKYIFESRDFSLEISKKESRECLSMFKWFVCNILLILITNRYISSIFIQVTCIL